MQDLRETRRRHSLLFQRLAQCDLISFRLRLHAQFIAFEGNPRAHRLMQLLLIIL